MNVDQFPIQNPWLFHISMFTLQGPRHGPRRPPPSPGCSRSHPTTGWKNKRRHCGWVIPLGVMPERLLRPPKYVTIVWGCLNIHNWLDSKAVSFAFFGASFTSRPPTRSVQVNILEYHELKMIMLRLKYEILEYLIDILPSIFGGSKSPNWKTSLIKSTFTTNHTPICLMAKSNPYNVYIVSKKPCKLIMYHNNQRNCFLISLYPHVQQFRIVENPKDDGDPCPFNSLIRVKMVKACSKLPEIST